MRISPNNMLVDDDVRSERRQFYGLTRTVVTFICLAAQPTNLKIRINL